MGPSDGGRVEVPLTQASVVGSTRREVSAVRMDNSVPKTLVEGPGVNSEGEMHGCHQKHKAALLTHARAIVHMNGDAVNRKQFCLRS